MISLILKLRMFYDFRSLPHQNDADDHGAENQINESHGSSLLFLAAVTMVEHLMCSYTLLG